MEGPRGAGTVTEGPRGAVSTESPPPPLVHVSAPDLDPRTRMDPEP